MAGLLANFRNTVILSVLLALVIVAAYATGPQGTGAGFVQAVFRWLHLFFGILWIGLLYYFNFVQIRKMPDIPAELKPAVSASTSRRRPCSGSAGRRCSPSLMPAWSMAFLRGHEYGLELPQLRPRRRL